MSTTVSYQEQVHQVIENQLDPETGRKLSGTQQIGEILVKDQEIECHVRLTSHSSILFQEIAQQYAEAVQRILPDSYSVRMAIDPLDRPPPQIGQLGLRVRSLIAVGSGKGGVGKSTLAASLALTLSRHGAKVGLLDADVYGPSLPHLLGLKGHPEIFDGRIQPVYFERIPVMSMGFLVKADEAVVWRGPMLHGAINQLLNETNWGELDYLIVDMPPGTGDVALTLSQTVPVTGAVVVCTPQQVALIDAIRAVAMLRKLEIPVLGMVEKMSGFICPHCNERTNIFGSGGARESAEQWDVPFLGEVPLNLQLQQQSDAGSLSTALEHPICAAAMHEVTCNMVRNINQRAATEPMRVSLPVL